MTVEEAINRPHNVIKIYYCVIVKIAHMVFSLFLPPRKDWVRWKEFWAVRGHQMQMNEEWPLLLLYKVFKLPNPKTINGHGTREVDL